MHKMTLKSLFFGLLLGANFWCQNTTAAASVTTKTPPGKILIINGISSSGKTSIIRALQTQALNKNQEVWIGLGLDVLWMITPWPYLLKGRLADIGIKLHQEFDAQGNIVGHFSYGPFGIQATHAYFQMIRAMVLAGHNIIVDEVLCDFGSIEPHAKAFKGLDVYMVGVHRNLLDAVESECLRGDRPHGLARGQIDRIHRVAPFYDLEVNTSENSFSYCAKVILDLMAGSQASEAFVKNCARLDPTTITQADEKVVPGKVVILNGCSSSGKNTIAKALQEAAERGAQHKRWMHIGRDMLWKIIPLKFMVDGSDSVGDEAPAFMRIMHTTVNDNEVCHINYSQRAEKLVNDFISSARALATAGINLVIDVSFGDGKNLLQTCLEAFGDLNPLMVGVFCREKDAIEREMLRFDRPKGLARSEFYAAHQQVKKYDLVVDTSRETPFECTSAILSKLKQLEKSKQRNLLGRKALAKITSECTAVAESTAHFPQSDEIFSL